MPAFGGCQLHCGESKLKNPAFYVRHSEKNRLFFGVFYIIIYSDFYHIWGDAMKKITALFLTFLKIGASQGGIAGALSAILGVILPSFIIIFIIAAFINNLLKYAGMKAFLSGIRPCVTALILATAVTMGLRTLAGIEKISDEGSINYKGILIFMLLFGTDILSKKVRKKKLSLISLFLTAAILGIILNP